MGHDSAIPTFTPVQGAIPKAFGTTLPGPLVRNRDPGCYKVQHGCYIGSGIDEFPLATAAN